MDFGELILRTFGIPSVGPFPRGEARRVFEYSRSILPLAFRRKANPGADVGSTATRCPVSRVELVAGREVLSGRKGLR